jgi:hypothetical protein
MPKRGEEMNLLLLLLVLNAGMLMGFILHTLLDGAHQEDASRARVMVEATPSFREDLLVPMMQTKHRYLN